MATRSRSGSRFKPSVAINSACAVASSHNISVSDESIPAPEIDQSVDDAGAPRRRLTRCGDCENSIGLESTTSTM